mmetsp:Transcript_26384/g.61779  ORF Transcript_26384/g.61779 Transcript_26384/m.61779 type:complete len:218 (-) Transcript_26384:536-1189(-)
MPTVGTPLGGHGAIRLALGDSHKVSLLPTSPIEVHLPSQIPESGDADKRAEVVEADEVAMRLLRQDLRTSHRARSAVPAPQGDLGRLVSAEEDELIPCGRPFHCLHCDTQRTRSCSVRLGEVFLYLAIGGCEKQLRLSIVVFAGVVNLGARVGEKSCTRATPLELGKLTHFDLGFHALHLLDLIPIADLPNADLRGRCSSLHVVAQVRDKDRQLRGA